MQQYNRVSSDVSHSTDSMREHDGRLRAAAVSMSRGVTVRNYRKLLLRRVSQSTSDGGCANSWRVFVWWQSPRWKDNADAGGSGLASQAEVGTRWRTREEETGYA